MYEYQQLDGQSRCDWLPGFRPSYLPTAKAVAGGINYSVRQLRIRVDELRRDAQWLSDLADAIEREDQDARTRAAK